MLGEAAWPHGILSSLEDRPHVLVVDDEPDVADTVSNILRQEQYEVAIATSAPEALRALTERPYDVLLFELTAGGADGLSLLAEVRLRAPTTCCIILTGYASVESAVAALRRGAYDYLVKPCVIEDLKQTVGRAIWQRRLSQLAAQREHQLAEMNDRLEERVRARTAELTRANQRLAEANAAKDRFLATLSHELLTPLTPLRAGLDLLKARLPGEEWQLLLEAMERNLAHEARLIDELLDIARITAGKLSLDKRSLDLTDCLRAAVEIVEPQAAAKEQALTLDAPGPFAPLLADPARLRQAVVNLLDNAVKFSPSKGRIVLSAWMADGQVFVQVVDSGPGIEPALLPRIFEPFWQADASSRRQHGGTGLGLAIAREIAVLHGGELRAANVFPGPGARFTLCFPHVPADAPRPASPRPLGPLRVLLVDDSLDTIQVLGWLLSGKGLQVREAASVEQAIEAARAEKPDVIITDIGMPDQDGYDLLRLLRAEECLCGIPVVAATGYVGSREQEQMASAGFAAALTKPFDLAELLVTLQRICPPAESSQASGGRQPPDEAQSGG